jgi:hypothetical protein
MHREWRAQVLAAGVELVDEHGDPVPAYASAGTAGQGWFSILDTQVEGPPVLQIDYSVGVADGSLLQSPGGELSLPEATLAFPPGDRVCWGCHLPGGFQAKRGTVWFDERDVHFQGLTNRSDADDTNDISDARATTCRTCHPGGLNHDFAKGNSPYAQFRNELDWAGFRSCRECHLSVFPDGRSNPDKHPDAPDVPGDVTVHQTGFFEGDSGPMAVLSCQACHVPYPLERGVIVTDWSLTGNAVQYFTDEFLSANAVDPSDADKSRWYPALRSKTDSDGVERFFPQKMEVAVYWADWDRNGTPNDTSDDTVQPVILWRLRQVTGNEPLPEVADDNGDGKREVNRPDEMLAYMQALKGDDSYGRPIAENPVLVKGNRMWYEDATAPEGVAWLDPGELATPVFPFEIFGLDHNVLAKEESWGAGDLPTGSCNHCHVAPGELSPVIDRKILVDPFDPDGNPVYATVREMTGLDPS